MTIGVKVAVFVVASVALAFLTRRSLTGLHTHGLYRLCAWIASVALVLLNADVWFDNPLGIHQLLSWLLLLLCVFAVVYGYVSLLRGRPGSSRSDESLLGVERTTRLVEERAYRYIRHPIYSSFLFGAIGVLLKDASLAAGVLTGIVILFAVLSAKTEEAENIAFFGEAYRAYMKRTRRFIPYVW